MNEVMNTAELHRYTRELILSKVGSGKGISKKILKAREKFRREIEYAVVIADEVKLDSFILNTVAHEIMDWCQFSPANIAYIDPGAPWQNAYVESFNGKLRDELLAVEIFTTLLEAKIMAEDYRQNYNKYRPHSSLNYMTPDEFALNWHYNNPGLTKTMAQ